MIADLSSGAPCWLARANGHLALALSHPGLAAALRKITMGYKLVLTL